MHHQTKLKKGRWVQVKGEKQEEKTSYRVLRVASEIVGVLYYYLLHELFIWIETRNYRKLQCNNSFGCARPVHFAYENEKKCHRSNLRSMENVGTTVRIVYSAVSGGTTVERQQSTDIIRSTNRNLTLLVLVPNTQETTTKRTNVYTHSMAPHRSKATSPKQTIPPPWHPKFRNQHRGCL